MEEQNRLKLEISEEMLVLKEFRDDMREETRYETEEIPKSQAEFNEEMYGFMAEFKEEFAQFRAQNDEQMADIHSKLHTIKELLHDIMKGVGLEPPLDQVNSNPDGPTLEYSAATIVLGNPADEMLELNWALDSEENGGRLDLGDEASNMLDGLSKPIHKTSEEFPSSLQDGFRLIYQQPSLKLRSVGVAHHLFDKIPELIAGKQTEGNGGLKSCEVSSMCLSNYLRSEAGVIRVSSTNFSSKSKFELIVNCWIGEISMIVFDPGGNSWFHMVWYSFKTNVDKQDFGFRFGEHNVDSYYTIFRWKLCLKVATMFGLGSFIVTRFPQSAILLTTVGTGFNASEPVWKKFMATSLLLSVSNWSFGSVLSMDVDTMAILGLSVYIATAAITLRDCSVEILDKLLGEGMLIRLVAFVNDDYNIQISVFGKMVQTGPNAYISVLLLDGGMTKNTLMLKCLIF